MMDEMGIYELPENLYHYTSLESLALILKNNTLRFSRLDSVNDPNEAISLNLPFANTAIFTSSWTSHSDESIPLWKMYTKDMDGVRIKLPVNMFKGRDKPTIFEKGGSTISYPNFINIERLNLGYSLSTSQIQGPNKIYYTDDEKYLYSKVINHVGDNLRINLYDLGLFKKKSWEFEQEWRFKILGFINEFYLPNDEYTKKILDLESFPIKNDYIDVDLEPNIFNEAEFTLGPKVNESQYIFLKSLLENYAPHSTICYSDIKIR